MTTMALNTTLQQDNNVTKQELADLQKSFEQKEKLIDEEVHEVLSNLFDFKKFKTQMLAYKNGDQ